MMTYLNMIGSLFVAWFLYNYVGMLDASFPNGKCSAQLCNGSPYSLSWLPTVASPANSFCYTVTPIDPSSCIGPCCANFDNLLKKIVIKTTPTCKTSFKQINIDGIKKGGGVFFDLYGAGEAELRMTSMTFNRTSIVGRTFCIIMSAPCNTLDTFCNGPCIYSIYDPDTHTCCPTCLFGTPQQQQPPPPMSLPLQQPPPPQVSQQSPPPLPSQQSPPPSPTSLPFWPIWQILSPPPQPEQPEQPAPPLPCESGGICESPPIYLSPSPSPSPTEMPLSPLPLPPPPPSPFPESIPSAPISSNMTCNCSCVFV